jgi:hypothetical protein
MLHSGTLKVLGLAGECTKRLALQRLRQNACDKTLKWDKEIGATNIRNFEYTLCDMFDTGMLNSGTLKVVGIADECTKKLALQRLRHNACDITLKWDKEIGATNIRIFEYTLYGMFDNAMKACTGIFGPIQASKSHLGYRIAAP